MKYRRTSYGDGLISTSRAARLIYHRISNLSAILIQIPQHNTQPPVFQEAPTSPEIHHPTRCMANAP
ncbi:hypothetical protein CBS147332_7558 [Penicillium roqueforti]|nr:hypothetical protein CBS147332_7558 [Penicillium roqueforti]KAI3102937.1 hypothetical protein CBS147331_7585 [Penicillium roqueforti]